METSDVFGISPDVNLLSYIDRDSLDEVLGRELRRKHHVAITGPSKSGKSWLRRKVIPDAITVQCRLNKTSTDIFVDALSQLGIQLEVATASTQSFQGVLSAKSEAGFNLLGKVGLKATGTLDSSSSTHYSSVGHDVNDLRFIADLIKTSGRRLVIEDFHYLKMSERKSFSFDLKALWEYSLFVVVIGIWTDSNFLIHLNPDLSGRVEQISLSWSNTDLIAILDKGCTHLNITFSPEVKQHIVEISYSNSGILQNLTLKTLDSAKIFRSDPSLQKSLTNLAFVEDAALSYSDDLNCIYQNFASRVSAGVRQRSNSTGIYAHALAVILDASDERLTRGLSAKEIFSLAYARQPRIQLGNLRTVLQRLPILQIDNDGRGLILDYSIENSTIIAIDRQLLLYRRYATVTWPWETLIAEASEGDSFSADNEDPGSN